MAFVIIFILVDFAKSLTVGKTPKQRSYALHSCEIIVTTLQNKKIGEVVYNKWMFTQNTS